MSARITFYGAAGTVTGSRTMVEDDERGRILVDCGMFQGQKALRLRNRAPFPFDPTTVDAVALTHAHLDHSGALPLLMKQGFRGDIVCTEPTAQLVRILLLDAAHLEEEQAAWANKTRSSKHVPALPLYTTADAEAAIARLKPISFGDTRVGRFAVEARHAGHILGAASFVVTTSDSRRVFFSGDVGRPNDVLMRPPEAPADADVFVVESTYGGRHHREVDARAALKDVVNRTVKRGGVLMVPAFAVGRAQALLFLLAELKRAGEIPNVPVFLNSPMATDVTGVYCDFRELHRLTPDDCGRMCDVATVVKNTEESKALNQRKGPLVVVAGSGMATGGRIIHHLAAWGPDKNSTVLLVGYQAQGTRGASLAAGAKELKIFGDIVPIRAEVARIDAMSGHADEDELMAWLHAAPRAPSRLVLNHGEPDASAALADRVRRELGWHVEAAGDGATVDVAAAPVFARAANVADAAVAAVAAASGGPT